MNHNSSVWLNMRDVSSWNWNLTNFTSTKQSQVKWRDFNVYVLNFLLFTITLTETGVLNLLEELCITRVYIYIYIYEHTHTHTHTHTHIYIYIYIYIYYVMPLARISLVIRLYRPSHSAGPLDNTLCLYRAIVDRFLPDVQHLHVCVKGSTRKRRLWARWSIPHVLFVWLEWF